MIVEPVMMNAGIIPPEPGFLAGLLDLLHKNGALLTFGEVKTGLTVGPRRRHREGSRTWSAWPSPSAGECRSPPSAARSS